MFCTKLGPDTAEIKGSEPGEDPDTSDAFVTETCFDKPTYVAAELRPEGGAQV